ncbi:D-glucuronyl C5-epimerase, partial [Operophtera brumata]
RVQCSSATNLWHQGSSARWVCSCMMHRRVNLRVALCALCAAALLLMLYWSHCADLTRRPIGSALSERGGALDDIECEINGEYSVGCRRDAERDEVFVPFSHIQKDRVKCISGIEGVPVSTQWEPRGFFYPTQIAQFGLAHYSKHLTEPEPRRRIIDDGEKYLETWVIYGKITSTDGAEKFEWSHSYGKIYHPKKRYDPHGTFVTFENYNVEVRDRVKCISGIEGVPVSTQWEPRGFFYPTQIAQFGLAHYSKHLTEPEPRRRIIDDGEKYLETWVDLVLSVDVMLKPNSSLTAVLQRRDKKETDEHVYHGIGTAGGWRTLTRDLVIDMQKGWALQDRPKRRSPRNKFM